MFQTRPQPSKPNKTTALSNRELEMLTDYTSSTKKVAWIFGDSETIKKNRTMLQRNYTFIMYCISLREEVKPFIKYIDYLISKFKAVHNTFEI